MELKLTKARTVEPISLAQAYQHLRTDEEDAQPELVQGWISTARQKVEDFTRRVMVQQTYQVTLSCFPRYIELPVCPVREVSSITYVDSAGSSQTLSTSIYQVDLNVGDRTIILPVYGETWPDTQAQTLNAVTVEFIAGYAVPFSTNYTSDANALAATGHPLADDDIVQVWNTGGNLPDPLKLMTNYYVVNSAADEFELATSSGGTPITLEADNDGDHFAGEIPPPLISAMLLLIGHYNENREASAMGVLNEIPLGIKDLLMPYASVRF